jgi:hypothetical protein
MSANIEDCELKDAIFDQPEQAMNFLNTRPFRVTSLFRETVAELIE